MKFSLVSLSLLGGVVTAQLQYTSTASAAVAAARATALTLSPTSSVQGTKFERYVQIFLENTDYSAAIANTNLAWLASQGISLTNYYATTHPSQPNYVAAVGASLHGITDNAFRRLGSSIKTIVDLLEAKGVSWSIYQEDMPYSGFQADWKNPAGQTDYVRKHKQCKNLTMFYNDLANNKLPQWMFITPNMTNNAHDSSISVAGSWSRNFLTPLLANPNFNINRTLVVLTFDEGSTTGTNRIYSVLLGSAVPANKVGTTNNTAFNHYSLTKTAELNWGLGDLGQNDVSANAFF
ncbi:hypothetical protein OQA88_5345 [Cercophora sp. LCS_1]